MLYKKHVDLILDFCNRTYAEEKIEGQWWVLCIEGHDGTMAAGQVQVQDDDTVTLVTGPKNDSVTFKKDEISSIKLEVE